MSIDGPNSGGKAAMTDAAAASVAGVMREAVAEEREAQAELFDPLTAEEVAEAQEELGPSAKPLSVVRHARERRAGRTPGSRNRRTEDTVKYLSQFGPDPAVAMMRIISEPEDMMVARSRQIDPVKKQLSWAEARAMRIRCAETMMPYFHGKQPVQVDATVRGVMLVEEISGVREQAGVIVDGIVGVGVDDETEAGE